MSAAEIRRPDLMVDEFAFWDESTTAAAVLTTEDTEEHRAGMAGPEDAELKTGTLRWNVKGWQKTPEERYARDAEIIKMRHLPERERSRLAAAEAASAELLQAGTAVRVLVEHSWHWLLVGLADGRRRWVKTDAVEVDD